MYSCYTHKLFLSISINGSGLVRFLPQQKKSWRCLWILQLRIFPHFSQKKKIRKESSQKRSKTWSNWWYEKKVTLRKGIADEVTGIWLSLHIPKFWDINRWSHVQFLKYDQLFWPQLFLMFFSLCRFPTDQCWTTHSSRPR